MAIRNPKALTRSLQVPASILRLQIPARIGNSWYLPTPMIVESGRSCAKTMKESATPRKAHDTAFPFRESRLRASTPECCTPILTLYPWLRSNGMLMNGVTPEVR